MKSKTSEELISMLLGLLVVVVIGIVIFNYFQRRKGSVTVPGVSQVGSPTAPPTPGVIEGNEYITVRGDSLWKLAVRKYGDGYKWVEIQRENNLRNPNIIWVGQRLKLPKLEIAAGESYVVVRGDSLWKIAVRIYGDGFRWVDIWRVNRGLVANPDLIYAGTRLALPVLK